jgi:V8-like Glu-specific endopeptidase
LRRLNIRSLTHSLFNHLHYSLTYSYDNDDRMEELEATAAMRSLGQAGVMLTTKSYLTRDGDFFSFNPTSFSHSSYFGGYALGCEKPFPYQDQSLLGWCSGALIADQFIATAGHCLQDISGSGTSCADTVFIFGATNTQVSEGRFPADHVYECSKVVAGKLGSNGPATVDFAIAKLDRAVPNTVATPIKIRTTNKAVLGENALLVGHPYGLPKKYNTAPVNHLSDASGSYYHWNGPFDAFGGNSGSGVYSLDHNEIIGILVEGSQDFAYGTNSQGEQCVDVNYCHPKPGESGDHSVEYECSPGYPYGEKMVGSSQLYAECNNSPDNTVVRDMTEWNVVCAQMTSLASSSPAPSPSPSPSPSDDNDDDDDDDGMGGGDGGSDNTKEEKFYEKDYVQYAAAGVVALLFVITIILLIRCCRKPSKTQQQSISHGHLSVYMDGPVDGLDMPQIKSVTVV